MVTSSEVAEQVKMFGYTWHQTVVAKIETAQRPLRLNEANAMARLFGVSLEHLHVSPADAIPGGTLASRITAAEELLAQAEGKQQAAQAALRHADAERARLKAAEQDAAGLRRGEAYGARLEGCGPAGLVFRGADGRPLHNQDVRDHYRRLCVRAQIGGDWQLRETRHTFVSQLSDSGVDIERIADAAGHVTPTSPGLCTATS